MDVAVQADELSYSYATRQALKEVSFAVPSGALFGLLGPNGSGKTTLFRLLSTLIPMQSGRLCVGGLDVSVAQAQVRQQLGVTFQSPAVDVRLTVAENLRCHGSIYGLSGAALKNRVSEMLDRFQLSDRSTTLVGQLSGGLKRRVELAKGLMHHPAVLLLDEPTTGLDPRARQEFWSLLTEQIKAHGTTVIVATHLMAEAELCDELLLLDQGHNVASGSPAELQSKLSGERLTLKVRDAEAICEAVQSLLKCSAVASGQRITVMVHQPAEQISAVLGAFREEVLGLELTRPSLDDVFLEMTGHALSGSGVGHE